MKNFKNDIGRSLMEMLLYLGLTVVLTTTALQMYTQSVDKVRMIETGTQIDDIVETVNLYYLGRTFSSGQVSISQKLKDALEDDIDFNTDWSDPITLTSNSGTAAAGETPKPFFTLGFSKLNQKNCINVANLFSQKDTFEIKVGSTVVDSIGGISSSCQDNDNNSVSGSFYKE